MPAYGARIGMGSVRAVVQRVTRARVTVDARVVGEIQAGALVLLGVSRVDNPEAAHYLAEKIANLRIFNDDAGKMNRSLLEIGGAALVVSQSPFMRIRVGAGGRPTYRPRRRNKRNRSMKNSFDPCVRWACGSKPAFSRRTWRSNS